MSILNLEVAENEFDIIKEVKRGKELWSARSLMAKLGYKTWQNFEKVIEKAQKACEKSGVDCKKHFTKITPI